MEVNFYKTEFGNLLPVSVQDSEAMKSIKNGSFLTVEINEKVNQKFHRKIFKLLTFCFDHWHCINQYMSAGKQFTEFRRMMVIKAGFYEERFYPDGSMAIVADSLAFKSSTDFPELFNSLLNIAINEIFVDVDPMIKFKLYEFL